MALRTKNLGETATRGILALSPPATSLLKTIAIADARAVTDIIAFAAEILSASGSSHHKTSNQKSTDHHRLNLEASMAGVPGLEELEQASAELVTTAKSAARAFQRRGNEIDRQLVAIRRVMKSATTA